VFQDNLGARWEGSPPRVVLRPNAQTCRCSRLGLFVSAPRQPQDHVTVALAGAAEREKPTDKLAINPDPHLPVPAFGRLASSIRVFRLEGFVGFRDDRDADHAGQPTRLGTMPGVRATTASCWELGTWPRPPPRLGTVGLFYRSLLIAPSRPRPAQLPFSFQTLLRLAWRE
jgi:hypothetical protein